MVKCKARGNTGFIFFAVKTYSLMRGLLNYYIIEREVVLL